MRILLPGYFRDKYTLIGTVTFTAFFSLLFLLLSIPFAHNAWFVIGAGSQAFGYTAGFYVAALLLVILSKWIMYLTRSAYAMTYLQYLIWNLLEIIAVSLLYTAFSEAGERMGIISSGGISAWQILGGSLLYCLICLGIPYLISGMFFALVDKNKTIRLMNTRDVVSDEPEESRNGIQKVTLYDNSGVMKLSVSLENLYYIESDDNYVIVWYTDSKGAMKKYMIRCRLKTIEESFKGSSLVRCHRKYIVNMDKVKVLRKEKDGYELDLENDAIPPISITRTYADNVLGRFQEQ